MGDEGGAAIRAGGFGDRLAGAMSEFGPLCVGVDPHASLLRAWGLEDDVEGLRRFSLTVVEALAGRVAALKPQAAFFERHGSAGVAVLEEVIAGCRGTGTQCLVDAKRGDIGSTMAGYADAYLGEGSPLAGDAVTLSPYLGLGSLLPALDAARKSGRGVFVLALTSNPEGASVQGAAGPDGRTVAAGVVGGVERWNHGCDFSHIAPGGVVVGATVGDATRRFGVPLADFHGPILAPGFGAQGAGSEQVRAVFKGALDRVLPSSSRAVLAQGPSVAGLRRAASQACDQLQPILTGANR
nr:orotidine-5'-phosphate decarboxylase [Actinomyces sp.]